MQLKSNKCVATKAILTQIHVYSNYFHCLIYFPQHFQEYYIAYILSHTFTFLINEYSYEACV